jgi:hypothetical protein
LLSYTGVPHTLNPPPVIPKHVEIDSSENNYNDYIKVQGIHKKSSHCYYNITTKNKKLKKQKLYYGILCVYGLISE